MGQRKLATIERACEIVDTVQELDGAKLTELADYFDLSPSTLHAYLSTLEAQSYLKKEDDVYQLGMQFLNRGGYIRARKEEYQLAGDKVKKIATKTDERVQFVVEESGLGYCLHTVGGAESVKVGTRLGRQMQLHATASGKAILSEMPESYVQSIIDKHGLQRHTSATITDEEMLFEELEKTRERGFAINCDETTDGIHAIGACVQRADGGVLGAFSILGPSKRLEDDRIDDLGELLLTVVNEMELNINYPG
jgi:DNA-binding IclR family transcriptional regulator